MAIVIGYRLLTRWSSYMKTSGKYFCKPLRQSAVAASGLCSSMSIHRTLL